MPHMAQRVAGFGTTIFNVISTMAREHGAVNLGQGMPDFDGPAEVRNAAIAAINSDMNQYSPGLGLPTVKEIVAKHIDRFYGQKFDPVSEVVITAGATEAMFAAILGLADPGDEVIVFEPVYDAYVPDMQMAGITPRYVAMRPPSWSFDPDELRAVFNERTRAIIINTPHNPTGKVYSREELTLIAQLCQEHDVVAICDEVYEHIIYDGNTHTRMSTLPGMADRTLTISSLGKTFSVTGWKIGWATGPAELVTGLNRVHQFVTYCVTTPLQAAVTTALSMPMTYFEELQAMYQGRRDYLMDALRGVGFDCMVPQGGYFIMADWRNVAPKHVENDSQFAEWLIKEVGVACIPPSAFYQESNRHLGQYLARFAVCKKDETLQAAVERLHKAMR